MSTQSDLSTDQLTALFIMWGYKAYARTEYFSFAGLGAYLVNNKVILELVELGLVKINKANSISMTKAGKALAPHSQPSENRTKVGPMI